MISVDPATFVITIPQADLIPLGGNSYQLDTNNFRTALNLWQASEDGCYQPKTHNHNTTVTLGGLTYARLVEIIDPYTITFEDVGQPYRVALSGSNNNILDKANLNNVSIASANAAGLIELQVNSGSGLSQEEHDKLIGLPDDTLTTAEHDKLMSISPSGLTTDEHNQLMAAALEDGGRLQSIDGRLPATPASQGDVTDARDAVIAALPGEVDIGAVWDELISNHTVAESFGDYVTRLLTAIEVKRGTIQDDGATVSKFITNLNETANGFWDRCGLMFSSGQCKGQIRGVKSYNGNTHEVSLETPLSYAPLRNDKFILITPRKYLAPNLEDIPPMVRTELTTELADIVDLASRLTDERAGYLDSIPDIEPAITAATADLAKEATLVDRPTLSQIEASTVLAKQSGFTGLAKESTVTARPTLSQIEASNVLAKQAQILRILGLSQENFRLTDQIYDGSGNLTSATVKTYGNATDAEDDTNPIAEYQMTATFTGPARCTSYLMKQVA